jgi:hypothetical protein
MLKVISSIPHWLSSLLLGSLPLVVSILLRIILDLRLAPFVIRYLDWIPVRSLFRDNPPLIRGDWQHEWDSKSPNFSKPTDRSSSAHIYQLGRYCYSEFTAKKKRYALLGRIHNDYIFGEWYAVKDPLGYFGSFKLEISSSSEMHGMWLGHSKRYRVINCDQWRWQKTE